jgi:hypothetical protein
MIRKTSERCLSGYRESKVEAIVQDERALRTNPRRINASDQDEWFHFQGLSLPSWVLSHGERVILQR